MSYYYKFNYVSPEPQYATVKEELKSYFDSGAIDDLLFPTYLKKCMDKLGRGAYYIAEQIIDICDFEARLPDNFYAVREAWMCADIHGHPFQSPSSFYSQAGSISTIQISPITSNGRVCSNLNCSDPGCDGVDCMPEIIQSVYKTNNEINLVYKKAYLLKPGNISVKGECSLDCSNFGASSLDSFDIRDNKFVTNFRYGKVYLIFYSTQYDNLQNQMIPDNFRIKEYVEKFLKFKVFETLCNQVNDETFNQLMTKKKEAQAEADEAFIFASLELKKSTVYEKQRQIRSTLNRNNKYELPQGYRGLWRRNGT